MNFTPLTQWIDSYDRPLVIAGPCSAETRSQVLTTARGLAALPRVKVFRAGVWKPRTRPGSFEGTGTEGLKWMQEAKQQTGLLTTVEVATPKHVQEALKYDTDILWIGARTVVNPFSMQELGESLRGVNVPVMIKNPVNPDLKLWMGAIERVYKSGITSIAAIHRGFYHSEKGAYRNVPQWEIPIELMRLMPGLPIICDPSHIAGKREMLLAVAQQSMDLEMDGLMIETHCNPEKALTDAEQQINPAQLQALLDALILRSPRGNREFERNLQVLRSEIDGLDYELIQLLAKRMEIVAEMGRYKYDHHITILQLDRWKSLFADRIKKGEKAGLNVDFLGALLKLVHEQSIEIQTNVMNKTHD
ncbi:MAG: chorismate mutase [Lentimicrobiaceae bacterium]|nr:chorismate mutase [Lentimicrobiaceae bacterium]